MNPIDRLIQALATLPGIGQKTATRLAFHILRIPSETVRELAEALLKVKATVRLCSQCLAPTPHNPCAVCRDDRRDRTQICVVEEPADLDAIEKTHAFRGVYHVLHGTLSPLDGIGPEDLKVSELVARCTRGGVAEVIIATNPTVEGEATATYITNAVKPLGIHITRIASGIPLGGEVEYTNAPTLVMALQSRRAVQL